MSTAARKGERFKHIGSAASLSETEQPGDSRSSDHAVVGSTAMIDAINRPSPPIAIASVLR
jgi:hypothetical protein